MTGTALTARPGDAGPGDAVRCSRLHPGAARGRRAGHPGPRPRASSRRPPWSASTTAGRRTGPDAPPCAPGPTTSPATTRSSRRGSTRAASCPRRRDSGPAGRPRRPRCRASTRRRGGRRRGRRGAPRRRPRRPTCCATATWPPWTPPRSSGSPRCSRRCGRPRPRVVRPGTSRWHRGRPRRLAHAARLAAPDGRARRPGLATSPACARAGSCCWSTCQRLDERRTPTRCCGSPTASSPAPAAAVEVVHPRHPAHPRHPRAAAPRPGPGDRRRRRGRARLVRRHPARRDAAGLPRPLGTARDGPRRRSSWSSATAGSAATRRCSASRWRGCSGSPTASCGSTRTAARPATSRCRAASRPRCRTVDDFVAGHSLAAFAELVEVVGRA